MNCLKMEPSRTHAPRTLSLAGALSAACLFAGLGGALTSMFAADLPLLPPLIIGLAVILLAWLLRRFRFASLIMALVLALGCALGLLHFSLFDGIFSLINRVSTVLGAHLGRNLARYAVSGSGEGAAVLLLSGLLALCCVWIVRLRSVLVAALICLPLAALDLLLTLQAAPLWIALLFAALLLLMLPEALLTCDSTQGLLAWLLLVCAGAGVFLGSVALLERFDLSAIADLRAGLLADIESARFGESEMTEGDFSELGPLELSADPMLEVTLSQPESLYLRGFVGSEYYSDGWKAASPAALSDAADLFYWLHQANFYGQTQLARLALLLDDALTADSAIEIHIRHIGASRKHVYSPYELMDSALLDPAVVGDTALQASAFNGESEYILSAMPNQVKRCNALLALLRKAEDGTLSDELDAYLQSESHYNRFVYAHFLSISDETRALLAELLGAADFGEDPHMDYGEAKQRILDYLNENISYRESMPPHLTDSDFLTEFLKINQCGYDVHYATAAVMMMRYFGIPARYVEGYLITPDDAKSAKADVPFVLSGERSHAWCEIYQDGLGWIPFEVAPKYLDLMERSDAVRSANTTDEYETPPDADEEPPEETSLDMQEDFHDDFEDEENPDDNPIPLAWLKIAGLWLALLLIVLILSAMLAAQIASARLRRSFHLHDRKQAVKNLYAHLFVLMQEIYGWHDCVAPSGFLENVRADCGEDAAIKYQKIIEICEESAFDRRGVLEEDYLFVYNFVRKTQRWLKKRSSLLERFRLRYIRHLI